MSKTQSDSGVELVDEVKKVLKGELQVLGADLKDVKQGLKSLNLKFAKIEGKLEGLEKTSHQTQGEIRVLKLKLDANDDKRKNLETSVQKQAHELQEINEDLEEIEETIESVDNNLRKNNIKLRGLPEGAEGKNLVVFSIRTFFSLARG